AVAGWTQAQQKFEAAFGRRRVCCGRCCTTSTRPSSTLLPQAPESPSLRAAIAASRAGASSYFTTLHQINRRIDDNLVALFDSGAYFHLRAQVARHRHLADARRAILDHGDLQPITVKNDRIGRHQKVWRLARDMQLD